MRKRIVIVVIVLAIGVIVAPLLTFMVGPAPVDPGTVFGVIAENLGFSVPVDWSSNIDAIVWRTRVPRVLTGIGAGMTLAISGVALQALIRNPLAEPFILGINSGASTGAAIAILVIGAHSVVGVPLLAFLGAIAALVFVMIAAGGHGATSSRLVLAGLAVGYAATALTNLLIFTASNVEAGQAVLFWMLGSLSRADWSSATIAISTGLALTVILFVVAPVLDALAAGDSTARSIGVNPGLARATILIVVSAGIAFIVSVSGGIGFVGLVIPHLCRGLVGHTHRGLVLASTLAGAIFLIGADAIARTVLAPAELPIGVITGVVGAPFLLLLMRAQNKPF
ncbi:iron ABC transporter permease [Stomatohabitans albus]|uniref:FecCD family ABC transporter permease n=1 Tax=Stomatohabitans albus TaxID=3110766 RepID=UPI00300C461D